MPDEEGGEASSKEGGGGACACFPRMRRHTCLCLAAPLLLVAGLVGLLRLLITLKRACVTPNLHLKRLNPHIDVREYALS